MNDDHLHDTVKQFKQFINKHPKLIEEIRKSGRSWQEYYEKWVLLGEDDSMWEPYKRTKKSSEKNSELFQQLVNITEKVDFDKVQKHVHQLNDTISILQEVLGQFQDQKPSHSNRPVRWFKD
ncbi:MAG TPA: spore coat protein YlbD [Bacillota bacterium]|nr:spore coat protein YlbD [Bacillota bacterium]